MYIIFVAILAYLAFSTPPVKGTFLVKGYKNGELIYVERFNNKTFTVRPGNKFDKIEIYE